MTVDIFFAGAVVIGSIAFVLLLWNQRETQKLLAQLVGAMTADIETTRAELVRERDRRDAIQKDMTATILDGYSLKQQREVHLAELQAETAARVAEARVRAEQNGIRTGQAGAEQMHNAINRLKAMDALRQAGGGNEGL